MEKPRLPKTILVKLISFVRQEITRNITAIRCCLLQDATHHKTINKISNINYSYETYILNGTMKYVPQIERTNSLQQDKIRVNRLLLVTGEPLLNIINSSLSLGHVRDNNITGQLLI